MANIRTAIIFSLITQYSVQIIGFISIIVFARLLTPAEIGVYAVAGSVSMLAMELRSLGVVQYLVREEHLTEHKIRTSLGMTVIVSWSLGALVCVCAPMVAVFYDYPALKHLLWIMSFQFWMVPFTSVPIALLKRELEFQKLLVIWVSGATVSFICTVILLLEGYGYYGLSLGVLVGGLSELAIAIYYQPRGTVWIPSFAWVGSLVRFGMLSSATNLFTKFSESIPDLVIGRMSTMANVGLFSRGLGAILFLNRIIVQAVSPVVLPHLANIKRNGGDLAAAYLHAIKLQGAFNWPIFAVVNVAAFPMIIFLFGDQWGMAAPVASALAIWAMLTSFHCFAPALLIVTGHEKLMFYAALISFFGRAAAVLITGHMSLEIIAWAIAASGVVDFLANMWAIQKATDLKIGKVLAAFVPNFYLAAICWFVTAGLSIVMPFKETRAGISILVIAICLTATWLVSLKLTRNEAWEIVLNIFRYVASRRA